MSGQVTETVTPEEARRRAGITWLPFAAATGIAAVVIGVVLAIGFFATSPVRHPFGPGWSIALTARNATTRTITTYLVDPTGHRQRLDRFAGVSDPTVVGWSASHRLAAVDFRGGGHLHIRLYELTENHISTVTLPGSATALGFTGETLLVRDGHRVREYDRSGSQVGTRSATGPSVTTSAGGRTVTVTGGTSFTVRPGSTLPLPTGATSCDPVRSWPGPTFLARCAPGALWTVPVDGGAATLLARGTSLTTAWRVDGVTWAGVRASCAARFALARVDGTATSSVAVPVPQAAFAGATGGAFYLVSRAGDCAGGRGALYSWRPGHAPKALLGGSASDEDVLGAVTIGQPAADGR